MNTTTHPAPGPARRVRWSRAAGSEFPEGLPESLQEAYRRASLSAIRRAEKLGDASSASDCESLFTEALLAVQEASKYYRPGATSFARFAWRVVGQRLARELGRQLRAQGRIPGEPDAHDAAGGGVEIVSLDALEAADHLAELADPAPGPLEQLLGAERAREVRAASARLPRDQRRVIYLRYWLGKSQAAVAVALDMTRRRVARIELAALRALRPQLRASCGE